MASLQKTRTTSTQGKQGSKTIGLSKKPVMGKKTIPDKPPLKLTKTAKPAAKPAVKTTKTAKSVAKPAVKAAKTAKPVVKPPVKAAKTAKPVVKPPVKAAKTAKSVAKPPVKAAKTAKPVAKPAVKAVKATKPIAKPAVKAVKATKPVAKPAVKAVKATKPVAKPAVKAAKATKPIAKPAVKAAKVTKHVAKPAVKATKTAKQTDKAPVKSTKIPLKKGNAMPLNETAPAAADNPIKTSSKNGTNSHPENLSPPPASAPYAPSDSEVYMNKNQIIHFRTMLEGMRQQLMEDVDRTVNDMRNSDKNLSDYTDCATNEEEMFVMLRTSTREGKLLKKIEEALQRIEHNDYGYCDSCGIEIGFRRLEARPTATLCIDCKTLDEIREKQRNG